MQSVIDYLKLWQPHPFVDHFSVAVILLGIVMDLVGSIFFARLWIRYTALTLMILGAIAAAGSNVTGGWEAHRVWDSVNGPGKAVLQRHAWWGDILPWVFGGLALWRLLVQFVGFMAITRPIYLLAALIGGVLIIYQGHLGSTMVYDYGIGTALLTPSTTNVSSPLPSPTMPVAEATNTPSTPFSPLPSPIPSVTPTNTPVPVVPTPASSPIPLTPPPSSIAPTPAPTVSVPGPPPTAVPSSSPSLRNNGEPITPPSAESPSPAAGGAKNL